MQSTMEEVKRAIDEQDRKLRSAYERLDAEATLAVPTESLLGLADRCSELGVPPVLGGLLHGRAVRC